jgi:MOSC domain-containing protein YiiM
MPGFKIGARMGDADIPRRFAAADRPGGCLRIVRAGDVQVGDQVRIVARPAHGVTVGEVADIYHRKRVQAARLLTAPELSEDWHGWAKRVIAGRRRGAPHIDG